MILPKVFVNIQDFIATLC